MYLSPEILKGKSDKRTAGKQKTKKLYKEKVSNDTRVRKTSGIESQNTEIYFG